MAVIIPMAGMTDCPISMFDDRLAMISSLMVGRVSESTRPHFRFSMAINGGLSRHAGWVDMVERTNGSWDTWHCGGQIIEGGGVRFDCTIDFATGTGTLTTHRPPAKSRALHAAGRGLAGAPTPLRVLPPDRLLLLQSLAGESFAAGTRTALSMVLEDAEQTVVRVLASKVWRDPDDPSGTVFIFEGYVLKEEDPHPRCRVWINFAERIGSYQALPARK